MGSHWVDGSDSIFIDLKSYQSLLQRVGKSGVFCVLSHIVTVRQLVTNYKLKKTGVLKQPMIFVFSAQNYTPTCCWLSFVKGKTSLLNNKLLLSIERKLLPQMIKRNWEGSHPIAQFACFDNRHIKILPSTVYTPDTFV